MTEPAATAAGAIGLLDPFIPSAEVIKSYLWGCAGSIFVEVALVCYFFQSRPGVALPARYSDRKFILWRTLMVFVSGAVVVAHGVVGHPWLAIHLGVATPALLIGLASELRQEA